MNEELDKDPSILSIICYTKNHLIFIRKLCGGGYQEVCTQGKGKVIYTQTSLMEL